jgi:hypothetical protein
MGPRACQDALERRKPLALAGSRTSIPLFCNPWPSDFSYFQRETFYTRIILGHISVVSHVERSERTVTGTAVLVFG